MHVSVTPLGSTTHDAGGAAHGIVEYLSGQSQQPGARTESPVPELQEQGRPGEYYADSAELPGRWIGEGAEELISDANRGHVQPEMLERVLLGQHPETGEQLVGARGSALRAGHPTPGEVSPQAGTEPQRLLTAGEAAERVGVDRSYITRLLRQTDQHATAKAIDPTHEMPDTYLQGTKVDRQWLIEQGELDRFVAARNQPRVVLGYDLTYSVSKSVSVAWAAADPDGRQVIESALHEAVNRSLRYVEDNAIKVRVGRGQGDGNGMVAAAFLHDTSRELEPQLHMHVVVANMARTEAGNFQALDGRGLFAHGTTSGYLAESEIQSILSEQGYRFGQTEKGMAHLEHIPQETVDAFSTRRTQILEEVAAVGIDSPAARQNAAYATRAAKTTGVDRAELEQRWQTTLHQTGLTPNQLAVATNQSAPLLWTPADTERLDRWLSSPEGVTRSAGIFDRRTVIQTITDYSGGRLDATKVQDHADRWLNSQAVLPLQPVSQIDNGYIGSAGRVALAPGTTYYTTPEVVATEVAIADHYTNGQNQQKGLVASETVETAIGRWQDVTGHQLGADQAAMVRSITQSGHQFQPVIGPAGSGKTTGLEVAARAWEADGYTVLGTAVNGNAAELLAASTGIESRTVASLLERLRYDATLEPTQTGPKPLLSERTVVLVDEASTLSNREHAELLQRAADHGATVRTIGDPAQHASVEAGGGWVAAVDTHDDIVPKLTENRRMVTDAMSDVRLASTDYRNGQIEQAVRRLERGDRIVTASTSAELLDNLAADWFVDWNRHLANPAQIKPSRMLAENHAVRRELNERAQVMLKAAGHIQPDGTRIGESVYHLGDQVIARKQDRQLRPENGDRRSYVRNGTKGVVVGIEGSDGPNPSLIVDFDGRGPIKVPHEFLTQPVRSGVNGGLTPAYAMTTHAAQGDTYDTSRAVITERSSTPGSYVALTRGRNDMRMYAVDADTFAPPNPAKEHGLPVAANSRTLTERIEAQLAKPQPTDLATKADPDLRLVHARGYIDLPVQSLEALNDPTARRIARVKLARAQQRTTRDMPAHLVAVIGDQGESDTWGRAVARYSNYRQRWGSDPLTEPPARPAGQPQSRQHADFVEALADARAERLSHHTPRQLSDAYQALPSSTAPRPVDPRTSEALQRRLVERQRLETSAHAAAKQSHQHSLQPKEGRINPDEAERNRRLVARTERDLTKTNAALNDLQTLSGAAPPSPASEVRVRIERQALDRIVDRHAQRAVTQPAAYLTSAVGTRPDSNHENWTNAAKAIERYRHRHLGLSPSDGPANQNGTALAKAIGGRPANGRQQVAWDKVQNLAASARTPGRPSLRSLPGPTLGRN